MEGLLCSLGYLLFKKTEPLNHEGREEHEAMKKVKGER
jgi:hypothetical protein